MRKLLIFSILLCMSFAAQAQEDSWKLIEAHEGINVYAKKVEFHDNQNDVHVEYVALRFKNTLSEAVTVQWKTEVSYDDQCYNCNDDSAEHFHELRLSPSEVRTGQATLKQEDKALTIFSRFLNLNKAELTNYNLTQFNVKR
jgi:hypothetical protein